jgi:PKD repeat protein
MRFGTPRSWCLACAVLASCLMATPAASASAPPGTGYARVHSACGAPAPGSATCFALVREPVPPTAAGQAGVVPYALHAGASISGPAGGLTPAQLASAYGYDPTVGGTGQTVAIVDAYDDPSIEEDLGKFDSEYKLAECTKVNGCFKKVSQTGSTTTLPAADKSGWSAEIALDVEAVRAGCLNCKILLVEANSPTFANLEAAVNEAVALGATEVSNSYGGAEGAISSSEQAAYSHPGVVIAASTGDSGYYGWTSVNEHVFPPERPNLPASLPSVVAVGGTTLRLTSGGTRLSETVWNGNGPVDERENQGASGGGCSKVFTAQPWQQHVAGFAATGCGSKRLDADVSAVADPLTGFDIYDSYKCGEYCENTGLGGGWLTIGGTSLSAPLVTSLYGLAGGAGGVSYPALTLYGHLGDSSLFDVTAGGNGFCDGAPVSACGHPDAPGYFGPPAAIHVDCEYTTECDAATGFDGPSGVGAPSSLNLFKPVLPVALITPPAKLKVGVAASFSASTSSDPYPGGSVTGYAWNWGDGTSESSGVGPSHAYATSGEHLVTLTVTDNYGLKSAPATHTVKVATLKEAEEEVKKEEEEAAAKKKAEEEAAAKKKAEEEAATKKKAEEEAATKKKAEEAATKKKAEEEASAKRKAEEEASAKRKTEEEAAAKVTSSLGGGVAGFQTGLVAPIPNVTLTGTSFQVSPSGALTVKLSCPAGESTCAGNVTLRTLSAVLAAAKRKASVLTLASGSFTVPGGKVGSVTLHLSGKARKLLARSHTLRVRATILAHDPAGATHTTVTSITLHAPKRHH